jgi:MYXO-CTERM domain-containing protein
MTNPVDGATIVRTARKSLGSGLALVALVCLSAESQAAPIKYEYGGVITSADPSTGVAPGTRFSGWFSYDPAKPFSDLMIEGSNTYGFGRAPGSSEAPTAPAGMGLQVGGKPMIQDTDRVYMGVMEIEYQNQWGYGQPPSTRVGIFNAGLEYSALDVGLDLKNPSRSVFGSLAPPLSLSLSDFPDAMLSVHDYSRLGTNPLYTGTIDTLQAVPTPEPASLACWGLVALGVIGMARRRRRTN